MKKTILLIGNHLHSARRNTNIWQEFATRLRENGWEVYTTSSKFPRIQRLLDMLWTIWLKRNNYQLAQVDVFSGPAFIWAEASTWFLRGLHKPYVLTLHGGNLPAFAHKHPKRVNRLLRSARKVITPSPYIRDNLIGFRSDIQIIPNALSLENYPYRVRADPAPYLVWLRAFHEVYNPSMAPKVLAELKSNFPEIHLWMVGPDKQDGSRQKMLEKAKELGVDGHIELPGGVPREQVPDWLNKGDIFINTTDYDTMPISVLEAMACGLCIVSTNVGGIPYLLENEEDSILVEPNNSEAMALAIERILVENKLAEKLSINARKKADNCDWSEVMPQWDNLFKHLINEHSR